MRKPFHRLTTVVREVADAGPGVRAFVLADPDGWELPRFEAGAHVDVHLPSGRVRQYSLASDPERSDRWRIAVKREDAGRGGSAELHETVRVGSALPLSLPRNNFPLVHAGRHLLIAGGIGITPFLSMIPVLQRAGAQFDLHYCSRESVRAPFIAEFRHLAGKALSLHVSSGPGGRLDVAPLLRNLDAHTHVYCCGPASLIETVAAAGAHLGNRLHVEWFGAPANGVDPDFEVELARSGRVIPVPRGQNVLSALREAGVEIDSSCEGGACLECKTRVLSGTPAHRDLTMNAAERREFFTPCVSGSAGGKLVLDL